MKIPKRNPKMYQLVAMESESSFWWDSVDSTVNLNDDHGGEQKFAKTDDGMLRAVSCNVAHFSDTSVAEFQ